MRPVRPDDRFQIIDGHLRAETTPDQDVPVLVLDVTEEEAEKLLLSIDPLAALAERDDQVLRDLLDRVHGENERTRVFLESLRGQLPPVLNVSHDETFDVRAAIEADKPSRVGRAELWALGRHRLLCGDATDPEAVCRTLSGQPADLVWTDPPYNVDYAAGNDRHPTWSKRWVGYSMANDDLGPAAWEEFQARWLAAVLPQMGGACYICMSQKMMPSLRAALRVLAGTTPRTSSG